MKTFQKVRFTNGGYMAGMFNIDDSGIITALGDPKPIGTFIEEKNGYTLAQAIIDPTQQCPACGSKKFTIEESERTIQVPYGSPEKFKVKNTNCVDCTERLDVSDESLQAAARIRSEKKALEVICEDLTDIGYPPHEIERILNWRPFGIIEKNMHQEGPVDSVLLSFMILIRELPEILKHDQVFSLEIK